MPKSAISVRRISLRHVSLGRRAALALAALLAAASALGASAQAQPGSAPHEIAFVDQTRAEVPVQAQIKLLCSDDEGRLFEKKALVVAGLGSGFVTPIAFPQCRGATLMWVAGEQVGDDRGVVTDCDSTNIEMPRDPASVRVSFSALERPYGRSCALAAEKW